MQAAHRKYLFHMANRLLLHNKHPLPLRCNVGVHPVLEIWETRFGVAMSEILQHVKRKRCHMHGPQLGCAPFRGE